MRAAWRATSLHARACRLSTDAALPSAAPSATCRQDVLAIVSERAQCDEQAATNVSLESDLKLKFEVLSRCERRFGVTIPHAALADLSDAESVARHFDAAIDAAQRAVEARDAHWSRQLPANVSLVGFEGKHEARNDQLPKLLLQRPNEDAAYEPPTGRPARNTRDVGSRRSWKAARVSHTASAGADD